MDPVVLRHPTADTLGGLSPKLIDPSTIDFSQGAILLNRSKRFVLPVPELAEGGEPLVIPVGDPAAGKVIYGTDDAPQRGIIFFNGKDSAWQGVQGNGKEAIIINDLSATQAEQLIEKIKSISKDPSSLTVQEIQQTLDFARNDLGLVDFFDKDMESVGTQMEFVSADLNCDGRLGYMQVTKQVEHRAVFVPGAVALHGPVEQRYSEGAVIVSDGKYNWGLAPDVAARNWVIKGSQGEEQPLTDLTKQLPEVKF